MCGCPCCMSVRAACLICPCSALRHVHIRPVRTPWDLLECLAAVADGVSATGDDPLAYIAYVVTAAVFCLPAPVVLAARLRACSCSDRRSIQPRSTSGDRRGDRRRQSTEKVRLVLALPDYIHCHCMTVACGGGSAVKKEATSTVTVIRVMAQIATALRRIVRTSPDVKEHLSGPGHVVNSLGTSALLLHRCPQLTGSLACERPPSVQAVNSLCPWWHIFVEAADMCILVRPTVPMMTAVQQRGGPVQPLLESEIALLEMDCTFPSLADRGTYCDLGKNGVVASSFMCAFDMRL